MPWMDANGICIHFELAGQGPSVVLLHEMGGTLDSWDGIAPALSKRFRTLHYDQRGSGLSEKVRQPITTEILVEDLEAVLPGSALAAPYHFVTVAAATMQALIYMSRHPDRIAGFVFKDDGIGGSSAKMMAMVGSFVGWRGVLLTIIAAVIGSVLFVPLSLKKKRLLPFGVFLAVGAAVAFVFGDAIIAWYGHFLKGD